jgi:hypothetical protein
VGRCRVRRPWLFWGELGVLAFCPQTSIAPTDPFSQENAPDLGAAHHDTAITRSSRQCIQRPVVRLPLLIEGFELSTTAAAYQTPWRLCCGQSDDPRAFQSSVRRGLRAAPGRSESPSIPKELKRWRRVRTVS